MHRLFKHILICILFLIPFLSGAYNMCTTLSSTDTTGSVFDAGGPNGNYASNQYCQFLIDPGCNVSITLTFSKMDLENSFDFLYVYDGTTTSGKLLLAATGSNLPSPVTSKSGVMLLVFISDQSITYTGFSAIWTTQRVHTKPLSNFTFPVSNPPLNSAVSFTDLSGNYPNRWHWDFGDGDTSNLQNPVHFFRQYKTYTIKLITYNCFSRDSMKKQIQPQDSAFISFYPGTFSFSSSTCSESVIKTLSIKNYGRGDLVYSFAAGDTLSGIRMLALTYGVDYLNEYKNTIRSIEQFFPTYVLTETKTTLADTLKKRLLNKNILLVPEQEFGSPAVFKTFSQVLQDYVYSGGNVIFCGSASSQTYCMFNTGLLHGSYIRNATGSRFRLSNKTHPLAYRLDSVITGKDATYICRFTDNNIVHLLSDSVGNDMLAYREYGTGKVFFIANDYNTIDSNSSRMIANILRWINSEPMPPWLVLNTSADTIAKTDSIHIPLQIETHGLRVGTYKTLLKVLSNDLKRQILYIPCSITVKGSAGISVSKAAISYNSCMEFSDVTDTVTIANTGCDSLKISGLNFRTTNFKAQLSAYNIMSGKTEQLIVHFNPQQPGILNDTLKISSNAGLTKIVLSGIATYPSAAKVLPDSFRVNMSCEDSTQFLIRIKNTNLSNLTFNIEGKNARDSIHLLALTYGADYYQEYANTLTAINTYFTGYHLSELNTTSAIRLDSALQKNDVLLVPEQESGYPTTFLGLASTMQNFANKGGTVIFCGSISYLMNGMFNSGLFSGTGGDALFSSNSYLNVFDTTNEITKGISSAIPSLNATFTANITNTDAIRLMDYNGKYDVVTLRNIGKGRAIFIAFDYFDYDSNSSKVIAQAIKTSVRQIKPAWIDLSSFSDTLIKNDSTVIKVKINTKGVFAGNYHYDIVIHTNDPLHSVIRLPVNMEVHCKPYADFSVFSNFVNRNDSVGFTDISRNFPTSWNWSFSGGIPAVSSKKDPFSSYPNFGLYDVKLIVSNAWGSDTVEKKAYIHVANSVNMCSATKTEYDSGYVFDAGGPLNKYYAMQTCKLLIAPPCALRVTLFFSEFNVENNWDYLYIYDGEDDKGTLLQTLTGNTIPSPVTAYSGKMFLKFVSDQLVEESGFTARWTSVIPPGNPPTANFVADQYHPPVKSGVVFTDSTSPKALTWHWDFGDGKTSDIQNPGHVYYKPGNYYVKLVVTNCYGKDSTIKLISVQDYPVLSYAPATLSANSVCNDLDTALISIYNSGAGSMTYEADTGQKRLLELLTYTYGINQAQAYPNTLQALTQFYPDINLTEISTLDSNKLRKALSNKDVFIVPEELKGIPDVFTDFSNVIQEFVKNGGTAIFCGSYDVQSECMFNTGLFSGTYKDYLYQWSDSLTITDTTNSITRGYGAKIPAKVVTYYYKITNPDVVRLIAYQGNDVLSYRKFGKGIVVFCGFNFYSYSDTISKMLSNMISFATSKPLVSWIRAVPSRAVISDSIKIKVLFDRLKLTAGVHQSLFAFYTNDTIAHKNYVPLQFTTAKRFGPVDLPAYAGICSGDSIRISAGSRFSSFKWNDSLSADSAIIIKLMGSYVVTVTDSNGCISTDSVQLRVHPLPVISMQPVDSSYCANAAPVVLDASPKGGNFIGMGVIKSTFYPGMLKPGNTSIYYLVTDTNGCFNSDSLTTKIISIPIVNLGKDTTILQGDSLMLDAGPGHKTTLWNQVNTGRYLNFHADIPGKFLYYAEATDSNGCANSDSIYITVKDTSVSVFVQNGKYFIKVYPNPANGLLNIDLRFSNPEYTTISLFSADGREIIVSRPFISRSQLMRYDISTLAKGIYLLKIIHGETVDRLKVVKE